MFISAGVSGVDICQSEFVCQVGAAQQMDVERRGDLCHCASRPKKYSTLAIDLVFECMATNVHFKLL